jgi:hypothetical protein
LADAISLILFQFLKISRSVSSHLIERCSGNLSSPVWLFFDNFFKAAFLLHSGEKTFTESYAQKIRVQMYENVTSKDAWPKQCLLKMNRP